MLKTQLNRIQYHGWQIQVVNLGKTFCFRCYAPNLPDYCNDGLEYGDGATALIAAEQFVDREVAVQALIEVTNHWLEIGLVSEDEYWNLTDFT